MILSSLASYSFRFFRFRTTVSPRTTRTEQASPRRTKNKPTFSCRHNSNKEKLQKIVELILTRRAMVVVYFRSFIFSLFIARMSLLLQHQILQGVSSEELKQSLEAYSLTSMSRSVCSILAWAIVCNRISMKKD